MDADAQIDALLRQHDLDEILELMEIDEAEVLRILYDNGYELPFIIYERDNHD